MQTADSPERAPCAGLPSMAADEGTSYQLPAFVRGNVPPLSRQIALYRSTIAPPHVPFDPTGRQQAAAVLAFERLPQKDLATFAAQVHVLMEQLSVLADAAESPRIPTDTRGPASVEARDDESEFPDVYLSIVEDIGANERGNLARGNRQHAASAAAAAAMAMGGTSTSTQCGRPPPPQQQPQPQPQLPPFSFASAANSIAGLNNSVWGSDSVGSSRNLFARGDRRSSINSVVSIMVREQVKMTDKLRKGCGDEGFKVINEYIILDEIGRGSFGKCKLAIHQDNGKQVAIKIVRRNPQSAAHTAALAQGSPLARARQLQFDREIAVMKMARHRNVVKLLEVIDDPLSHKLYLVMQYVDRGAVGKMKEDRTYDPIEPQTLLAYAKQIISGLAYLHGEGITHHDVKPENILVSSDGEVFLSDFGISEFFALDEERGDEVDEEPEHEYDGLVESAEERKDPLEGRGVKRGYDSSSAFPEPVLPQSLLGRTGSNLTAGGGNEDNEDNSRQGSDSATSLQRAFAGSAGAAAAGTTVTLPGGYGAFAAASSTTAGGPAAVPPIELTASSGRSSASPIVYQVPPPPVEGPRCSDHADDPISIFLSDINAVPSSSSGGSDRIPERLRPGSLPFMAPENFDGTVSSARSAEEIKQIAAAGDVFAFGVTIFALLTGRLPFATARATLDCDKLALHGRADIPIFWAKLLKRILMRDPRQRPSAESIKSAVKQEVQKVRRARRRVTLAEQVESEWGSGAAVNATTTTPLPTGATAHAPAGGTTTASTTTTTSGSGSGSGGAPLKPSALTPLTRMSHLRLVRGLSHLRRGSHTSTSHGGGGGLAQGGYWGSGAISGYSTPRSAAAAAAAARSLSGPHSQQLSTESSVDVDGRGGSAGVPAATMGDGVLIPRHTAEAPAGSPATAAPRPPPTMTAAAAVERGRCDVGGSSHGSLSSTPGTTRQPQHRALPQPAVAESSRSDLDARLGDGDGEMPTVLTQFGSAAARGADGSASDNTSLSLAALDNSYI